MFIDSSAVVAILSEEDDAASLLSRIASAPARVTSALVILESAMRLSTKLALEPLKAEIAIKRFLQVTGIEIMPIEGREASIAIEAFSNYGKGRSHPAQLNLADCVSYACAKSRGIPLLYKGNDFSRTDLAAS